MQATQSLHWESNQHDDKITLRLKGELSQNTLLPLWQQRASFLLARKTETLDVHWDLSQVNRIDSAGFALLCDFLNERKQLLQNPPSQLLTLADLFGLSDWIAQFSKTEGNS